MLKGYYSVIFLVIVMLLASNILPVSCKPKKTKDWNRLDVGKVLDEWSADDEVSLHEYERIKAIEKARTERLKLKRDMNMRATMDKNGFMFINLKKESKWNHDNMTLLVQKWIKVSNNVITSTLTCLAFAFQFPVGECICCRRCVNNGISRYEVVL